MTPPKGQGRHCDPITLEIIVGAMRAAQSEMETLLERTSMSPFMREKKDYWAALYDQHARMVAGSALPLFGKVIEPIFEIYPADTMRPGDIYWFNDCYFSKGAVSHSPDQILVMPVFEGDRIVGYSQTWGHISDIGGMYPGSLSPKATSIFQEGIIVPPVRICRDGEISDELFRLFQRNSRSPEMIRGDMRALFAAVRLGAQRMAEIFEEFGVEVVHDAFAQLQDRTEAKVHDAFRGIFDEGSYEFADSIDTDGHGNGPFTIRASVEVGPGQVIFDGTRSDDQAPGPVNYLMQSVVPSMVLGVYFSADDANGMLNDGHMRLFDEVRLRRGSILQPEFPAPLGQRGMTWVRLQGVMTGLVNVASQGKGVASNSAYVIYYMRGNDPATGLPFLLQDGVGVGWGARPFSDGLDSVYYVAQENYPAEFLNSSYPVRMRGYSLNRDSGGPGRWRGGMGVIREIEVLSESVMVSMRIDNIENAPLGVAGGKAGRPGRAVVNPGRPDERVIDPLTDGVMLKRGDILSVQTGGGGGWGHPFDRPAEDVRLDVLGGIVSPDSALEDYGVVLGSEEAGFQIECAATARRRGARPDTKLFHRNDYFDWAV